MKSAQVAALCALIISCGGDREPPTPLDNDNIPPGTNGPGPGATSGAGGTANQGGGFNNHGGGGNGFGGDTNQPVAFPDCGCALETLNTDNALCGECVDATQDTGRNEPCFVKFDTCLQDPKCLNALGTFQQTCDDDRSLACAESVLAGTPSSSAIPLIEYFDCICSACSNECAFVPMGGGGAGGGPSGECTIDP